MNVDLLLRHFDCISEAPDAVPRLRRFILDLAVRGKLVEQDPNDEPAIELLKRITAEQAQLVRQGIIKKQLPYLQVNESEMPYDAPIGWIWTRLGQSVNNHLGGGTPSKDNPDYWDGDIFWASVKDIGKTKYIDQTIDKITDIGLKNSSSNLIPPGNLIIATRMGLGKVSINLVPIAINQDLRAIILSQFTVIDYYYIFLKTVNYEGTGLTVKGIKVEELLNLPFPLPPLNEQRRIAAKVDELMTLCDELEAAQAKREKRRDRLVAATLHGLNNEGANDEAGTRLSFEDSARFYFNHLPRLTTRPKHIQQLRQTILNLAVRGRLVEQDPEDGSVYELLKRIEISKSQKAKTGKRDCDSTIQTLDSKNMPFSIPSNWVWVSLGSITICRDGERIPVSEEERRHRNKIYDYYGASGIIDKIDGFIFDKPLLLVGEDGANLINRSTPIAFIARGKYWVNNHAHVLDGISEEFLKYIELYINAIDLTPYITGTAQPKMNQAKMNSIPIALPPETEQVRILAKVDELLAVCNELETELITATTSRATLLEAVIKNALETNHIAI